MPPSGPLSERPHLLAGGPVPEKKPDSLNGGDSLVSVIVPCYNSARTIRTCLHSVLGQKTSVPYEIVVVDSSLDQTPQIVAREFPDVRLIHFPRRIYAGAARNVGIGASRAPYCLMLDSDCVAPPDLLERMLAWHKMDGYAAVGGALRQELPMSVSDWVAYVMEFREFMPSCPRRLERTVPTASVMYRREVFEQYGGFDAEMRLSEDILFHWGIHLRGERIFFDPAIEVLHRKHVTWRKMLSYQRDLGLWSARARKRGGLPGQVCIRHPSLALIMPFVRLGKAFLWLGRHDRRALTRLCGLWPVYLVAAICWSWGFWIESRIRLIPEG
jgi:GT2 family glycosyltransferase